VHRQTGHGRGTGGKRRGEGLAFARGHLGQGPLQQQPAGVHLAVVVALADDASSGFAHHGKEARNRDGTESGTPHVHPQCTRTLTQTGIVE
jgi:hypothetical protein